MYENFLLTRICPIILDKITASIIRVTFKGNRCTITGCFEFYNTGEYLTSHHFVRYCINTAQKETGDLNTFSLYCIVSMCKHMGLMAGLMATYGGEGKSDSIIITHIIVMKLDVYGNWVRETFADAIFLHFDWVLKGKQHVIEWNDRKWVEVVLERAEIWRCLILKSKYATYMPLSMSWFWIIWR